MILGWAIGGEALTGRFLFGGLLVIAAIALVSRGEHSPAHDSKVRELLPS
jgi:drug/metabolite transporter (DMT)-like permease